ncbi:MAG: glucose 1-dehydrogenase [Proteobacteria bacterium]|nr:glucose 1-dehydrogenase [Pseudomonadota bacterium]
MGRLDGKVSIITGAARGQGETTARLFASEGSKVVLTDLLEAEGETVAADIGAATCFVKHDVTSEADWRRVVETAVERFGRLDILVNNAGIMQRTPVVDCSVEEFRGVLDVNLVGPFIGMKIAAPVMRLTGGGAIVNVSSIQGIVGRAGTPGYTASKFGLRGLTKTTALELGTFGIRVNSIHPGGVDTPLIRDAVAGIEMTTETLDAAHAHLPVPRCGRPEDIAPTSLFLASDEAGYITGAELVIDGGMTCGYTGRESR